MLDWIAMLASLTTSLLAIGQPEKRSSGEGVSQRGGQGGGGGGVREPALWGIQHVGYRGKGGEGKWLASDCHHGQLVAGLQLCDL